MASNPLFIIPDFFLHFPNELSYGYLRFEGNGKIPLQRKTWYSILGVDTMPLSLKNLLLRISKIINIG
jgi:hypothetical protein